MQQCHSSLVEPTFRSFALSISSVLSPSIIHHTHHLQGRPGTLPGGGGVSSITFYVGGLSWPHCSTVHPRLSGPQLCDDNAPPTIINFIAHVYEAQRILRVDLRDAVGYIYSPNTLVIFMLNTWPDCRTSHFPGGQGV